MSTSDAVSVAVPAGDVFFSIILFGLIYLLLLFVLFAMLKKKINHGFENITPEEAK
jgi:cytochrome bd-type quinol oxidase subunit 1